MMGQNHIGELTMTKMISAAAGLSPTMSTSIPDMVKKWGLSFLINTAKTPEGRSPGSLAWAGLANTYFWIDPARDVTGVILMQVLPFADGKCLEAFAGFERGVYAGLDAAPEGGVRALNSYPPLEGEGRLARSSKPIRPPSAAKKPTSSASSATARRSAAWAS